MATANIVQKKKPCAKCDKGAGILTCDGCQQSFCLKHLGEHRQELSMQMDTVGQDHDILQRDINREADKHPLISCINLWEQESINKIQQVAAQARADLNELIKQNKQEFMTVMNKLNQELQSSRESEDYTELDLDKWSNQLNELSQHVEQTMNGYVLDEINEKSVIHLIRVKHSQQLPSATQTSANRERFCKGDEPIKLSENDLVATYDPPSLKRSCISFGVNRYSIGRHNIPLQIENKTDNYFFIGIVTSSEINSSSVLSKNGTVNGWWRCDYAVVYGVPEACLTTTEMQKGDELTLTLDCDKRQIFLRHDRTERTVDLSVDINKCPLPWKLVVGLGGVGDSIRLIQ